MAIPFSQMENAREMRARAQGTGEFGLRYALEILTYMNMNNIYFYILSTEQTCLPCIRHSAQSQDPI